MILDHQKIKKKKKTKQRTMPTSMMKEKKMNQSQQRAGSPRT
jgi:hypothetical protein